VSLSGITRGPPHWRAGATNSRPSSSAQDQPGLRVFACLPLPDVEPSLEELSYAVDVLGLDGFVLFTNSNGVYLGDPVMEPVFQELERRQAVVFVHPNPSPDAAAHALGLPDNLIDFPTDTNRAVAQMHYTSRFARTPHVKYIFSHAGGSIPTWRRGSRSSTRWASTRPGAGAVAVDLS
jgi:hypothetical protein